jgi:hypothetical protein
MLSKQMRIGLAALLAIGLMAQSIASAQSVPDAAIASGPALFPQLPLKRESSPGASALESLGWMALLLAVGAIAAIVLVRRKGGTSKGFGPAWMRAPTRLEAPKLLSGISLAQHPSLHVVEWNGEELLLGCTAQGISVLARRDSTGAGVDATAKVEA